MKALAKYKVWVALVIVALISWWASGLDEDAAQTSTLDNGKSTRKVLATKAGAAKARQRDVSEALALIAVGFAPRQAMSKLRLDPFTVASFEPPPPPPPPPQKPTAPPLNFKYLGVLREDAESRDAAHKERAVFLDSGGQMLIARKGDTLIGQYRVIEIDDTSMQLEYLPLAERQTLNFGR